ncbi:MAG: DNA polymerase III subunit beta [Gammaproteobacteria bacterium]|nr:DNA polymerase III subunit beta [Gammaproteobacteria bacterium]
MKITINRDSILKPLQVVSGVVEKRQSLPILSNVLLVVEDLKLTLTGTDLEVELTASTSDLQANGSGEITLPARKFMDICKSFPETSSTLDILIEENKAIIRSGKSRFTLTTLPATDFPSSEKVTAAREFIVTQATLKHLIEQTHFCMANQDVRYYLNGLLLEMNPTLIRAVATDGHRLALSEQKCEIKSGDSTQIIIPRKGIMELNRLLDDADTNCTVQVNPNYVRINLGNTIFTSKLIDGRFPDYERVIPKGGKKIVTANRELLRQGLLRASILSNEKYRGVRMNFSPNLLRATVNNPEQEEAIEEIDINYQDEELEIGFNVSYVVEALNSIKSDEVEITLMDPNSSCVITALGDDSSRYVVMPMRL